MALKEWTEKLSVKIISIDEEHKYLLGIINDFYEQLNAKSNRELIGELICKMRVYTINHFTTEEEYFRRYNYPEFALHKREHDEFVNKVVDLENRYKSGILILSFEITRFLKDWLVKHIQGTDVKYSDFLRKNGVL